MTEGKKTKKLSRRDAIKLIGAATGATILANLPSKWNTPEIASGVLPAHAQTSNIILYSLVCANNASFQASPFNGTAGLTLSPNDSGVIMNYSVFGDYDTTTQNVIVTGLSANGTTPTGVGGIISVPIQITVIPNSQILGASGGIDIVWTFNNPLQDILQGQSNCTQEFNWVIPGVIP